MADVIYPLFMFMMGMSMYISLKKFSFTLDKALFLKIIRRTFLIFIIGTFIYGTATFLGTLREASLQPDFVGSPWKAALHRWLMYAYWVCCNALHCVME